MGFKAQYEYLNDLERNHQFFFKKKPTRRFPEKITVLRGDEKEIAIRTYYDIDNNEAVVVYSRPKVCITTS